MTTSLPSLRHIGVAAVAALSVMATSAQASNVNLKSFLECRSTKLVNFPGTIVDAAIATPELSTLVNLVVSANLVGALSAPGNLTVYAPTNDAFGKTEVYLRSLSTVHRGPSRIKLSGCVGFFRRYKEFRLAACWARNLTTE